MKIFISHMHTDSAVALSIQNEFKKYGIDSYLDVTEGYSGDGIELTKHIKDELKRCTEIIVIISGNTRTSWWVPFEIGMASQDNKPIVTFLMDDVILPSYLKYWPTLSNMRDITKYLTARSKTIKSGYMYDSFSHSTSKSPALNVNEFYKNLREELRKK